MSLYIWCDVSMKKAVLSIDSLGWFYSVGVGISIWILWGASTVNAVGYKTGGHPLSGRPGYLPNNTRYMHGSYKVVSMLFIAKAVLR